GEVGVHDPAAGGRLVFHRALQVRDDGAEAVLRRAEDRALAVDVVERGVDVVDDGVQQRRGGRAVDRRAGDGGDRRIGGHVRRGDRDRIVRGRVGTDLEGQRTGRGTQDGGAVERGAGEHAADFRAELLELLVQRV